MLLEICFERFPWPISCIFKGFADWGICWFLRVWRSFICGLRNGKNGVVFRVATGAGWRLSNLLIFWRVLLIFINLGGFCGFYIKILSFGAFFGVGNRKNYRGLAEKILATLKKFYKCSKNENFQEKCWNLWLFL